MRTRIRGRGGGTTTFNDIDMHCWSQLDKKFGKDISSGWNLDSGAALTSTIFRVLGGLKERAEHVFAVIRTRTDLRWVVLSNLDCRKKRRKKAEGLPSICTCRLVREMSMFKSHACLEVRFSLGTSDSVNVSPDSTLIELP